MNGQEIKNTYDLTTGLKLLGLATIWTSQIIQQQTFQLESGYYKTCTGKRNYCHTRKVSFGVLHITETLGIVYRNVK